VTSLVSSTGTVLQRADYTPYGIQAILSPSWATATDAYGVPYSFQGGRQDPVTGLVHFSQGNAGRDFDVYLGTAVEQDPALGVSGGRLTRQLRPNLQPRLARSQYLDPMLVALTRAGSGYVSGFNRYQVEGSNPLQRVDPSGLSWLGALGGALSGGILGGIIAGGLIAGGIVATGGLGAIVIIGIAAGTGAAGGALLGSPYNSVGAGAVHGVPAGIGAGVLAPAAPVLCPSLLTAADVAEQEEQELSSEASASLQRLADELATQRAGIDSEIQQLLQKQADFQDPQLGNSYWDQIDQLTQQADQLDQQLNDINNKIIGE
jgi:hypothetical protein